MTVKVIKRAKRLADAAPVNPSSGNPANPKIKKGLIAMCKRAPDTIIVPEIVVSPSARRALAPTAGTAKKIQKGNRFPCTV